MPRIDGSCGEEQVVVGKRMVYRNDPVTAKIEVSRAEAACLSFSRGWGILSGLLSRWFAKAHYHVKVGWDDAGGAETAERDGESVAAATLLLRESEGVVHRVSEIKAVRHHVDSPRCSDHVEGE